MQKTYGFCESSICSIGPIIYPKISAGPNRHCCIMRRKDRDNATNINVWLPLSVKDFNESISYMKRHDDKKEGLKLWKKKIQAITSAQE